MKISTIALLILLAIPCLAQSPIRSGEIITGKVLNFTPVYAGSETSISCNCTGIYMIELNIRDLRCESKDTDPKCQTTVYDFYVDDFPVSLRPPGRRSWPRAWQGAKKGDIVEARLDGDEFVALPRKQE